MKRPNILIIILIAIALIFTITISKIVPKDIFSPYILQLDGFWNKINEEQEYKVDINNDQTFETIVHHNINSNGHSMEFHHGEKIQQVHIFEYGEKYIGKCLKFADIDNNSTQELIFVTAQNSEAYLNIYSYNTDNKVFLPLEHIRIDTIGIFNKEIDAFNNFIVTVEGDIYLDLQGSYSVQPRHIYKYSFNEKTLIKNRINSIVSPEVHCFNYQNQNYLLATQIQATGNTVAPSEAEMLRSSTDKDSLALYERYKHLEYEYGDFSSYILLYDDSLRFAFEPIEFYAWTNFTKSAIISINDRPHIIAFTNAQMNEAIHKKSKSVVVCNLQGEIKKQIPLPHNYTEIFSENENAVFYGDNTLFITDGSLNPINEIENITFAQGFEDLNKDNKAEFIAFSNNTLKIYSSDFNVNAKFKIEQEAAPYPEECSFVSLKNDNKNSFVFNSRLFYYQFSYSENNIAFLKYPFFITVFLVIYGILYLIIRINSERLKNENKKLEQIVIERTNEIAKQKEEIQNQANELEVKNKNLHELNAQKDKFFSIIAHDLKSPFNGIMGFSELLLNQISEKDYEGIDEYAKIIGQSSRRAMDLLTNLLDWSRAQTGRMEFNPENLDLADLIEEHKMLFDAIAGQKGITIKKVLPHEISVFADRQMISTVLRNLISNAIKFTKEGGEVKISTEKRTNEILIFVSDNGIGISPERLEKLFRIDESDSTSGTNNEKGTGLGLILCKEFVENHGGKIWAESEEGKGSVFYFTILCNIN